MHTFVRAYFDFSDEDAAKATQVGVGGHDKGIDAFYVDELDGVVYIIGGTLESRSFGPEILVDIERAKEFLCSPSLGEVKPELRIIWNDYRECMKKEFLTHYIFATLGVLNDEAKRKLEKLRSEGKKQRWEIDVFEKKEVLTWVSFPFYGKGPDVTFTLETEPLLFAPTEYRSIVLPVDGAELAKIVREHRYSVFALNLREYLGRNPVNAHIEESLRDDLTRKLFWYLNLGVDAICDRFDVISSPQKTLVEREKPKKVLEVKNFRIVNGLQTSVMLQEYEEIVEKCYFMLRLIETTDRDLAFRIAVAKNRQTPIRGRDLFAQEPAQVWLAKESEGFIRPFFYERRTKDWDAQSKRIQIRRKFGKRVIRNDEAARAYLATFLQRPFEAEHKGRYIFYEYGGLYQDVFRKDLRIKDFITADEIFRVVKDSQRRMRKEYRALVSKSWKEKLSDEEQNKLRDLSYLVHGAWYLSALLWHFINKYIPEANKGRLFTYDRPLSKQKRERLNKLYKVAGKVVVKFMMDEERKAGETGLRFPGARNIFARTGTYDALKKTADLWVESDEIISAIK